MQVGMTGLSLSAVPLIGQQWNGLGFLKLTRNRKIILFNKLWKQPKCTPGYEWIKTLWYTYIQRNVIQPYNRMKPCHLLHCMDLEGLC